MANYCDKKNERGKKIAPSLQKISEEAKFDISELANPLYVKKYKKITNLHLHKHT